MNDAAPALGGLRSIPYMGVIYVVAEATKLGFRGDDPDWCNLGQGQPEVGPMAGAPERISRIDLEPGDHAYGPIGGTDELRQAVADHMNRLYRQGQRSQYTLENVSVASGGRLVLSRIFAALGAGKLGYQIPDYTAYEDMIGYHLERLKPVLLETRAEHGFALPARDLRRVVQTERLGAYVLSNPCNPTGSVVQGDELDEYVAIAREEDCTFVLDEFYSQFIYTGDGKPGAGPVSAARYVDRVDSDPVLLVDGLTKGFRYPGWRVGWAVGPKDMIETLGRAASAIDGGPPKPIQRAAIEALQPGRADQETTALREVFVKKRNLMLERLEQMGVTFARKSEGTFYVWGNMVALPAPLNDPERFFREALQRKVLTVPGKFFDVNPGQLRTGTSPCATWMRFSFGPPEDNVRLGLDRLGALVEEARQGKLS